MGQCLVTRLKEVVNDSSLLRLGEKTFLLLPNGKVTIRTYENMPIRVVGEGSLYVDSAKLTEGEILKGNYITIQNAENYSIVVALNKFESLDVFTTNDSLSQQMEIDLSFFSKANRMRELTLSDEKIVGGTLKDLAKISESTTLTGFSMKNSIGLKGSILDIKDLNYSASVFPNFGFCQEVTGEIIDFVKAQRAKGRTSANIAAEYHLHDTKITFNGQLATTIDENQPKAISWTATTITIGSVTINA